jgi:stachyose synthetase
MTVRLYRFDECVCFHTYKEGDLLHRSPEMFYDTSMPKAIVCKAAEIENVGKAKKKGAQGGDGANLSSFDAKIS